MRASANLLHVQKSAPRLALTPTCFGIFTLILLSGYAVFGKGFAYLGVPPVAYVGEIGVLLAIVTLLSAIYKSLWRLSTTWLIVAFMLWGALRTFPYVADYGIELFARRSDLGLCYLCVGGCNHSIAAQRNRQTHKPVFPRLAHISCCRSHCIRDCFAREQCHSSLAVGTRRRGQYPLLKSWRPRRSLRWRISLHCIWPVIKPSWCVLDGSLDARCRTPCRTQPRRPGDGGLRGWACDVAPPSSEVLLCDDPWLAFS